jgi:Xaa-Pro aminopeptidase
MNVSVEKRTRIQKAMESGGFDALVVRISEHVLYFTGYWPQNHVGMAVVPASGKPVLLIPELEAKHEFGTFCPSEDVDVVTFQLESGVEPRGHNDAFATVLPEIVKKLGLAGKIIGIEESVEMINYGVFQGEVKYPGKPTWDLLAALIPGAQFRDASGMVLRLREVKSEEEINAIRIAVELSGFGIEAMREAFHPGMKETELGAIFEATVHTRGVGYKGVSQARGYASIYSGDRSPYQYLHYAHSSDRVIREGDMVIMELATFADGYWSDITRNIFAGTPPAKVQDMYEVVIGAQKAALAKLRAGVPAIELYNAASLYFEQHGYPKNWPHALGHGVGTAYHETPYLHLKNDQPVEDGMVLTIEPGQYIEGVAGIRPEDMVVVRKDGYEHLSEHIPQTLGYALK